jgi:5-hydroxyisourate hydrolase-like protein (transthyretin family)
MLSSWVSAQDYYREPCSKKHDPSTCCLVMDKTLNQYSTLAGYILYTNMGTPFIGVKVTLYSKGWKQAKRTVLTNKKGYFDFGISKPGKYYLIMAQKDMYTLKTTWIVNPKIKSLEQAMIPHEGCIAPHRRRQRQNRT